MSAEIHTLEDAMEVALRPGRFIDYEAAWDFVRGVEKVAAAVKALVDGGRAAEATSLFETFIAASYEKAEEIDDSSGSFGAFVGELFCDWVRARQAAKAKPEETIELLLTWMDHDDYGFCHELERGLVEVLDAEGLRAFAARVRARLDAAATGGRGPRRWALALKCILAAQGDAEGYLVLAGETAIEPQDCNVIAGIWEARGDLAQALGWTERGLTLAASQRYSSAEYDLKKRRRSLLLGLGHTGDAIAAAWADFEAAPGIHAYGSLVELLSEDARPAWHERAMVAAERASLGSAIDLFVATGEIDRLATRIGRSKDDELERMGHTTTEPAAAALATGHPALAARVYRALGLRVVNSKKSRYYDAALANIARARDCYQAAGQAAAWDALVAEVRQEHGRKYSFIPGFERLVAGGPATEPRPSFLERARSRWPQGGR